MACLRLDENILKEGFLDKFDYIISDVDGVIWTGRKLMPKAPEIFSLFRKLGKKLIFLSNDDTQPRPKKLKKFKANGIEIHLEELFTSAYMTVLYANLLQIAKDKKIYVMGLEGLVDEFEAQGYSCLPIGLDSVPEDYYSWFCGSEVVGKEVGAVVVGIDTFFSYKKLSKAKVYLQKPEVPLIATSGDPSVVRPNGQLLPGAASLVAAVSAASGRTPYIAGKPSLFPLECIRQQFPDVDPEKCLLMGDSLETDIRFGNTSSMTTLLVLTGVASLEDVSDKRYNPKHVLDIPDFYIDSLETFYQMLQPIEGDVLTHTVKKMANLCCRCLPNNSP